jgi:hypothetical protein
MDNRGFYEFEEKEHKALCQFFGKGGILDRMIEQLEAGSEGPQRARVRELREGVEEALREFREACAVKPTY